MLEHLYTSNGFELINIIHLAKVQNLPLSKVYIVFALPLKKYEVLKSIRVHFVIQIFRFIKKELPNVLHNKET
jgi:hypothetical protein